MIAAVAARQFGVVARAQLIAIGLGEDALDHRVRRGSLHRVHQGVFAVGHRVLPREGVWLAAVLAAGPGAVLSHRSAAALWGLRDAGPVRPEVTVARRRRRPRIITHRIALAADEMTVERGIPVTTPARTLLDLADRLGPHRLERAIHEAEYRRLTSPVSLEALLARHHGRRGTKVLREMTVRETIGRGRTRSALESAFLALLDAADLPRPRTNAQVDEYEVDAIWPAARLIVELDGHAAHGTRRAFEADRARDRDLQTRGYTVLRVTWRQLHDDAPRIAAQVRAILTRRATVSEP